MQESALARTPGGDLVEASIAALHDNEALAGLLLPHVPLVLEQAAPADTEACLNGIAHTIAGAAAPAAVARLAGQFVDTLAANTAHRAGARISAMLEMFNTAAAPAVKHALVLKVLEYARAARIGSLAASLHGKAEAWERRWELDGRDAAALFAAVAAVLDPHPSPLLKREAFTLRTKVLLGGKAADGALRGVAHAALLSFVANGALFVCDCFPAPAVQALKGDAEAGAVFELVSVMLRGDLRAFQQGDYAAVFEAAETTEAAVLEKARSCPSCLCGLDVAALGSRAPLAVCQAVRRMHAAALSARLTHPDGHPRLCVVRLEQSHAGQPGRQRAVRVMGRVQG